MTDNLIAFEDLVILALDYNVVTSPQLAAVPAVAAPAAGGAERLTLVVPRQDTAGMVFEARIDLRAGGRLHALSVELDWSRAVAEPMAVRSGGFFESVGGVTFAAGPAAMDGALLGAASPGLTGEGAFAIVTFRALADGNPMVRIAQVRGRDRENKPVAIDDLLPNRSRRCRATPGSCRRCRAVHVGDHDRVQPGGLGGGRTRGARHLGPARAYPPSRQPARRGPPAHVGRDRRSRPRGRGRRLLHAPECGAEPVRTVARPARTLRAGAARNSGGGAAGRPHPRRVISRGYSGPRDATISYGPRRVPGARPVRAGGARSGLRPRSDAAARGTRIACDRRARGLP